VRPLSVTDQRHFDAAQGWLALGDWRESSEGFQLLLAFATSSPMIPAARENAALLDSGHCTNNRPALASAVRGEQLAIDGTRFSVIVRPSSSPD
jgi:hypothetical protein